MKLLKNIMLKLKPWIFIVFIVVVVRGFIFEPFKIPSKSMLPTLLVGDYIFVKRYAYGLRIPFTKLWLFEFGEPQRGDVVVFTHPEHEDVDFIKRVVGLPGDYIELREGELFLNGQKVEQRDFDVISAEPKDNCVARLAKDAEDSVPKALKPFPYFRQHKSYNKKVERFDNGNLHYVQRYFHPIELQEFAVKVPERSYFVMGDNRDQSLDSRFWGMVPRENLKGKAKMIWLSLNDEETKCAGIPGITSVRWYRFGRLIN